jgi:hypothetical protein
MRHAVCELNGTTVIHFGHSVSDGRISYCKVTQKVKSANSDYRHRSHRSSVLGGMSTTGGEHGARRATQVGASVGGSG